MTISLITVKMKDGSDKIKLETPYHPDAPARLKAMGGKWNGENRVWYLPTDVTDAVRQLCQDVYGVDPMATVVQEMVTLRIDIGDVAFGESWFEFGRGLLRRPGRDSAVKPGDGVSIIAGGFSSSGGSRNNPRIGEAKTGTIVLVRDVPRTLAEQYISDHPAYNAEIVAETTTPAANPLAPFSDADLVAELERRGYSVSR